MAAVEFRTIGAVGWNLSKGTEPSATLAANLNASILSVPLGGGDFIAVSTFRYFSRSKVEPAGCSKTNLSCVTSAVLIFMSITVMVTS